MKDTETKFIVNGKEYKAIFNLNVMQAIQIEYGTFEKWGELTDGYAYDEDNQKIPLLDKNGKQVIEKIKNENGTETEVPLYKTKEVDIRALVFGIKEMLNEAIDIENEKNNTSDSYLTEKQVGRLITTMGIENATRQLNDTVINSTQDDIPKNE